MINTKVEFFNDTDVSKLEAAINKFLEKDICVYETLQTQSSYVVEDPDLPGSTVGITVITYSIRYSERPKN